MTKQPFHVVLLSVLLLATSGADAATITADGTTCTLADAIVAANTDTATGGCPAGDTGADLIVLDADVTLTAVDGSSTVHDGLAAGLPDVVDDLVIRAGSGSVIQREPTFTCEAATADPVFRIFNLESASLSLEGIRFEDGCAVAPTVRGGVIRAAADTELTLSDVTVSRLEVISTGGDVEGGFVYTVGEALGFSNGRLEGITLDSEEDVEGGAFFIDGKVVATMEQVDFVDFTVSSGNVVDGTVIYLRDDLTLSDATFSDFLIDSGTGMNGGLVHSRSTGDLLLERVSFLRVTATIGNDLEGGVIYSLGDRLVLRDVHIDGVDMTVTNGCSGGAIESDEVGPYERLIVENVTTRCGGAIVGAAAVFSSSETVLRDCVFRDNEGLFGGSGSGDGSGGALWVGSAFSNTPSIDIERCAFINNRLTPASPASSGSALGGAIGANRISSMRNVTFSGNVAEAGDGIEAVGDGGSALGGAVYLQDEALSSSFANVTLTDNRVIAGAGADGFADGVAQGGGLYVAAAHSLDLIGSILSGNLVTDEDGVSTDEDCFSAGTFTSSGYNLVQNSDSSCDVSAFGDITGLDPGLYPVDDYGCLTLLPGGTCVPTAAIDQSSWAVDWASCAEAGLVDDARRFDRRRDIAGVSNLVDACDAGAFEAQDTDGDGITDVPDLCPGFDDFADEDLDTVPDGCDACVGDDASGDGDADGVCDDSDACPGFDDGVDSDGDGVADGCDICVGDDAVGDGDGDGLCDDSDASVGNRVWLDDGDGIQSGGESGIENVTVHLYDDASMLLDSTTTDGDGLYAFSPGPGSYYLEFVLPVDMAYAPRDQGNDDGLDSDVFAGNGTTAGFTLAPGQLDTSRDAGFEPAVIGNLVWLNHNGDGRKQPAEPGVETVTVRLLDAADTEIATTTTSADGLYQFLGIATGTYRIEIVPPSGSVFSTQNVGSDELIDSDVDPSTGRTDLFSYTTGTASRGWDAGVQFLPIFIDGFETGDLSAWSEALP